MELKSIMKLKYLNRFKKSFFISSYKKAIESLKNYQQPKIIFIKEKVLFE